MTGWSSRLKKQRTNNRNRLKELSKEFIDLFFDTSTGDDPGIKEYLCVIIIQNQEILDRLKVFSSESKETIVLENNKIS